MTEFLTAHHMLGLVTGLCTFLIIGLFHPVVIKCHYYFGLRCRWWFVALGIAGVVASIVATSVLWSTLAGVFAFSSFWTVKEIGDQERRVAKGWFPANPRRAAKESASNADKTITD